MMRFLFILLGLAFGMIESPLTWAQELSVKALPPSVVKTIPQCGDTAVDAVATKQIVVTFSKDMQDGNFAFTQRTPESFPKTNGKPRFLKDKRTCVLDVNLEPQKTYVIGLNSEKFKGFMDTNGNSAIPYLLVFETK
jgi:hypothetical protein